MKINFLLVFAFTLCLGGTAFATLAQDNEARGSSLFKKGLYEKSIPYFQAAVQEDPEDWKAYEKLGNVYMKLNDNSNALDAYDKSLNLNPDNSTLQTLVDNLKAQGPSSDGSGNLPPVPGSPTGDSLPAVDANGNKFEDASPAVAGTSTPPLPPSSAPRPRLTRWVVRDSPPADGLNPINHERVFSKLELGYDYSVNQDLIDGASALNNEIAANGYAGSGSMQNSGFGLGAEVGLLLNPYNGIAMGTRYLRSADYNLNETYPPNPTTSDFETLNIQPAVVPITLDYYLFLPDASGRFFLTAGVGCYIGILHVDQFYDDTNGDATRTRDPGFADAWNGNLYGSTLGFQVGLGREWAVTRRLGFSLFAKGYYAKISQLTGTLYDNNGVPLQFGLAKFPGGVTDVDLTSSIGNGGETYASVDFTGFEAGFAFTFYSY